MPPLVNYPLASTPRQPPAPWLGTAGVLALSLLSLIALEWTTIDLSLAHPAFDPARGIFRWRDHWLLTLISHDALKYASTAAFVWIAVSVVYPLGMLRRLDRSRRLLLLANVALCLVAVSTIKRTSALHCPWDLIEFGGHFPYLRLFEAVPAGWSRGACFPAGHALSGFAYVGGYFALRGVSRRLAISWLAVSLAAGFWAGIAQQLRGAHFLSHTLWTLWWCAALSALLWFAAAPRD